MIHIELWGGPADGSIIPVTTLGSVFHVPIGCAQDTPFGPAIVEPEYTVAVYVVDAVRVVFDGDPPRYTYAGMA